MVKHDACGPHQLGAIEWVVVSQLHAPSLLLGACARWNDPICLKSGPVSPSNWQGQYLLGFPAKR